MIRKIPASTWLLVRMFIAMASSIALGFAAATTGYSPFDAVSEWTEQFRKSQVQPDTVELEAGETQLNPNPVDVHDYLSISAEMLNFNTRDDLIAALGNDRTIAELAAEQGRDPQDILEMLIAADEEVIQVISASGGYSEAEANNLRAASVEFNTQLLFNPLPEELPDDFGDVPFDSADYPEDNDVSAGEEPVLGDPKTECKDLSCE